MNEDIVMNADDEDFDYVETPAITARIQAAKAFHAELQQKQAALLNQKAPPQPGDVYSLASVPFYWLLVERHSKQNSVFRAILVDDHPMVGSCDVRLPPDALIPAQSARCAREVLIHDQDELKQLTHIARMAPRHFHRVCNQIAQVKQARRYLEDPPATTLQYAIDRDSDYQAHLKEVSAAINALEQFFEVHCIAPHDQNDLLLSDFLITDHTFTNSLARFRDYLYPYAEFSWRFDPEKHLYLNFDRVRNVAALQRPAWSETLDIRLSIDVGVGEPIPVTFVPEKKEMILAPLWINRIVRAFNIPEGYVTRLDNPVLRGMKSIYEDISRLMSLSLGNSHFDWDDLIPSTTRGTHSTQLSRERQSFQFGVREALESISEKTEELNRILQTLPEPPEEPEITDDMVKFQVLQAFGYWIMLAALACDHSIEQADLKQRLQEWKAQIHIEPWKRVFDYYSSNDAPPCEQISNLLQVGLK